MSEQAARELFRRAFGREPTLIASAPGRVNLIGEHVDYNGGPVLPIAIARRTVVAVGPSHGSTIRVVSAAQSTSGEFDPRRPERASMWWDYIAGVTAEFARRGTSVGAANLAVWSDVPAGAGLSSSAALEVAAGLALACHADIAIDPHDLALLAHRAESAFVGVAVGVMDQFASALARAEHALYLECDTMRFDHVPMREAVLIFDTAIPRALRGSAYNERRAECERAFALLRRDDPALTTLASAAPEQVATAHLPPPLDARVRHVISETQRVRRVVELLHAGGRVAGELLIASHESLRDDYACSTRELDWFVEHAVAVPGICGARLTGAGWGGCAIAVGEQRALADAAPYLAEEYEHTFRRAPRTWISDACDGASVAPA